MTLFALHHRDQQRLSSFAKGSHTSPARRHSGATRISVIALTLACSFAAAQTQSTSILDHGALPDGKTLNTVAIQQTIDEASHTGATVEVPPGTYLTGSIFLKSGVTLHLQKGAVLLGSQNLADYPILPTRVAGIEMSWPAALVNIYQQHDVTLTGEGTIDGDGKIFWDSYRTLRAQYEPRGLRWASDYDARRPRLVQVFDSSQVHLGGDPAKPILLRRSGFWTLHICYSHDVTVDGVTIRNNEDGRGPSTDGIDIDSSRHILVAHADIAVNDDALCLKAGRDSDGLRVNRPTEDVILRDSVVRAGAAGVTFGSETSGGFHNIEAFNITVLAPVPVGILFKSAHTRGGTASGIRLHGFTLDRVQAALRITMNWNPSYSYATIPPGSKDFPAYWTVLATPVPPEKGIAHIADVEISDVHGTAKTAFEVDAYPQAPLTHFTFTNLNLQTETAGHIDDAKDWTFHDLTLHTADNSTPTLKDDTNITGLPKPAEPTK